MHSFRLSGIDPQPFEHLFELDDETLSSRNILRRVADAGTGFPCRVSLEDAAVGDELLLFNYLHHDVESPYRASGPIYVRRGVGRRVLAPDEVPPYVTRRMISVRAYDEIGLMVNAEVVQGAEAGDAIRRMLNDAAVAYLHLHNAPQGCFSCRVDRAMTE